MVMAWWVAVWVAGVMGGRAGWRWGPGAGLAEWGWAKRFDFGKGGGKVEGRGNALPQYLQYGKL